MIPKAFIDTSAWISYSLSRQPKHSTIKNLIKTLIKTHTIIYTSNDVVDETVTRLIYDANAKTAGKFIDLITSGSKIGSLTQLWVDEETQNEAFTLAQKFSEYKLSLTDCTSIVLIRKNKIESVVSLDSDFKRVGISTLP